MTLNPPPLLIAIMGPTASGKSDVAERLADRLGLQLVNADAFMVYRGLDIGTNKPKRKAEYELIDIVGPDEEFGVGEFVRRAADLLHGIYYGPPSSCPDARAGEESAASESGHPDFDPRRGAGGWRSPLPDAPQPPNQPEPIRTNPNSPPRGAVVVGGTGFYVRALFEQYADLQPAPDPALRERLEGRERTEGLQTLVQELESLAPEVAKATDLQNPVRVRRALERAKNPRPPIQFSLPPFRTHKFVLDPPQEALDAAIAARVDAMFAEGWREEVAALLAGGLPRKAPGLRAIGYECVIDLLEGRLGEEEAKRRIVTETRQYAKRQRTWLRTEPNARAVPMSDTGPESVSRAVGAIMDCLNSLGQ